MSTVEFRVPFGRILCANTRMKRPPKTRDESEVNASKRAENEHRRALERANARLELLARAGEVLASPLEMEATLQGVADLAVPHFADWCLVDFLEKDTLRRVAVAHGDEYETTSSGEIEWIDSRGCRHPVRPHARHGTSRVALSGKSELLPFVDEAVRRELARDQAHGEMLCALQINSLLSVPMCARGQIFGVLTFAACCARPNFCALDETFATELGKRMALAIDNARLLREAQIARARAETARANAETASRVKDEFLAILSHELRTPLTVAHGWLHLFRGDKLDANTKILALDAIERALATQSRLVNELIETSRIAGGTLRLEVTPLALAPILEEAIAAARERAHSKGITISLNNDRALHEGDLRDSDLRDSDLRVRGDAGRLRQIIENLLANAIKFSSGGDTISVRLEAKAGEAWLVVEDSGIGISPEFLPHVFDRFRQSEDSATRAHGGLGLGLAIARHFTELHGGTLSAYSAGIGKGATFTLSIPLLQN